MRVVPAFACFANSFILGRCSCLLGVILLPAVFAIDLAVNIADRKSLPTRHLRFNWVKSEGRVPGPTHIGIAFIPVTRRPIEVLVHDSRGRLQKSNGEWRLLQTIECSLKGLHVGDFP